LRYSKAIINANRQKYGDELQDVKTYLKNGWYHVTTSKDRSLYMATQHLHMSFNQSHVSKEKTLKQSATEKENL
jgi:hypothetical protein